MKDARTTETTNFEGNGLQSTDSSPVHGAPELIGVTNTDGYGQPERTVEEIEGRKRGWFAYFKTRDFYIVLVLGYVPRSVSRECLWLGGSYKKSRN